MDAFSIFPDENQYQDACCKTSPQTALFECRIIAASGGNWHASLTVTDDVAGLGGCETLAISAVLKIGTLVLPAVSCDTAKRRTRTEA